MITKFKMFENKNFEKYINHFLILKIEDDNTDYAPEVKYVIIRCNYARNSINSLDPNSLYIEFDCFDIDEKYNILDIYADCYTEKIEKIDTLNFLTTIEFYNRYQNICTNFYISIRTKYELEKDDGYTWMVRMLKDCKDLIETLPEFRHYVDAEKYNL